LTVFVKNLIKLARNILQEIFGKTLPISSLNYCSFLIELLSDSVKNAINHYDYYKRQMSATISYPLKQVFTYSREAAKSTINVMTREKQF
jgi:hypothetical protein